MKCQIDAAFGVTLTDFGAAEAIDRRTLFVDCKPEATLF